MTSRAEAKASRQMKSKLSRLATIRRLCLPINFDQFESYYYPRNKPNGTPLETFKELLSNVDPFVQIL